jgi:hypothetical protein
MSMASTKQTKTDPAAAAPPGPVRAAIGYALGALIGLGVLWVVAAVLRTEPPRFIDELPHLTVVAEFDDLRRQDVREQLGAFERSLVELGLLVQGPVSSPILVPCDEPGHMPIVLPLDRLTPQQVEQAAPYFSVGGWVSPRIIAPDLHSVVFRACPKPGEGFSPSVAVKLNDLLHRPGHEALTLTPYSHALALEDPAARQKTNVSFGVQTVIVFAMSEKKEANTLGFQLQLLKAIEDYKSKSKVRSCVCEASFIHYAAAVRLQRRDLKSDDMGPADPAALANMALATNVPRMCARDGAFAWIEASTDAEGPQNKSVGYDMAVNTPRFPALSGPYRFDRDSRR